MNAIVYKNIKTNLPGWANSIHENEPRGIAYKHEDYFVHLYGKSGGLWTISTGLTASQQANGSLEDWTIKTFGAEEIKPAKNLIGEVVCGVWRPGLYFQSEIFQAFSIGEHEQRSAEQALKILIEKLDDLLLYIEPSKAGLDAFSHKNKGAANSCLHRSRKHMETIYEDCWRNT